MEQLTEDIKIILNNVQKDNIITLSDNLVSYIAQELKKLKYEKIPSVNTTARTATTPARAA